MNGNLADGWARFVEPDWARRRTVIERDIHHRAGVIAVSGWRRVLDGMAPGVQWVGHDAIRALADHSTGDGGVARLLGRGRARVVAEVRMPATPSQLAAVLGVSLGTTSHDSSPPTARPHVRSSRTSRFRRGARQTTR